MNKSVKTYIPKIRTGEQLERENYLLCFRSKSQLASMLIDAEEKIDKAIEYIEENKNKTYAPYGDNEDTDYEVCLDEDEIKYLLETLKGDKK